MPNYKPQLKVYGEEEFYGNGQTFATRQEAECSAVDRYRKWTMAEDWRVIEVGETEYPVNYKWSEEDGDVHI